MTKGKWENICINFDEFGMQPGIPCDDEAIINHFKSAFKEVSEDLEELERYRNEKYKHWNIFFNGAKLEYLLYLEQKGKESFMTSISEELFSKIKEHFLEKE